MLRIFTLRLLAPISFAISEVIWIVRAAVLGTTLLDGRGWQLLLWLAIFAALAVFFNVLFAKDAAGEEFVCTDCGTAFHASWRQCFFAVRLSDEWCFMRCHDCGKRTRCRRKWEA